MKKLEEAEKAKEQAEQDGFDVGVAETEEAFRVEVSEVCRFYCLQVWNEALDQAGVEASFALRWAESVYYPPAICAPGSSSSKVDTAFLARKVQQKLFLQLTSPSPQGGRAVRGRWKGSRYSQGSGPWYHLASNCP